MDKTSKFEKVVLSLSNVSCSYCSRVIEQKLKNGPGIVDVSVSYLTDKVLVRYDPDKTSTAIIRGSIKKIGYETIEGAKYDRNPGES